MEQNHLGVNDIIDRLASMELPGENEGDEFETGLVNPEVRRMRVIKSLAETGYFHKIGLTEADIADLCVVDWQLDKAELTALGIKE